MREIKDGSAGVLTAAEAAAAGPSQTQWICAINGEMLRQFRFSLRVQSPHTGRRFEGISLSRLCESTLTLCVWSRWQPS